MIQSRKAHAGTVAVAIAMILSPGLALAGNDALNLEQLGTLDTGGAEISAYDAFSRRLFVTNATGSSVAIVDASNPAQLVRVGTIDVSALGSPNSVAAHRGIIAVAIEDAVKTAPGKIAFYRPDGTLIWTVTVGALPDMITFTPDGRHLLVANEGEPATDYSVDPEGSVSVIDMTPGAAALTQANVTNLGFTQFDADIDALRASGVRIFGPSNTVSQNVEPEYITVGDDGKTAWVTLQEANALAVIDLENNVVSSIVPLGLKDGLGYSLDASDQAPGIFFNNWKIKGMYQPDAIAHWSAGGNEYLITANEGDVREWDA